MASSSRKPFPTSQRKKWLQRLQQSAVKTSHGAVISPSLKIVLDSNIWISAIVYSGNAEKVVLWCLDNANIIISDEIADELHAHFRNTVKAPYKWLRNFSQSLEDCCEVVPTSPLEVNLPVRDANDYHVLIAATETGSDYIITGDDDLLTLKTYQNVAILSPAEFLSYISPAPQ